MALANRQKPYMALTTINLPFIEKFIAPGEPVEIDDLVEAQQTDDDVAALIEGGALGEEGDDLHPDSIIPDPGVPTIQTVIAQAQTVMAQLEEDGKDVPAKLRAVAELDYRHVAANDKGSSAENAGGGS